MPTYRDEAVVLRTHKLGEADRIVTMLSRRNGKIRAVAKGVRRTSSKFGSRLEPFMVADVQLYQGRSLDIVQQAESLGAYGADIAVDYERFTAASAMVETADRLNEAEATSEQYLLLVGGLRSLSRGEHAARSILDSYLLRVMALSGWAPALEDCAPASLAGDAQNAHQGRWQGALRRMRPVSERLPVQLHQAGARRGRERQPLSARVRDRRISLHILRLLPGSVPRRRDPRGAASSSPSWRRG